MPLRHLKQVTSLVCLGFALLRQPPAAKAWGGELVTCGDLRVHHTLVSRVGPSQLAGYNTVRALRTLAGRGKHTPAKLQASRCCATGSCVRPGT